MQHYHTTSSLSIKEGKERTVTHKNKKKSHTNNSK